jgi:hypothetical protein
VFVSVASKTCGSCGLELPASAFNRAGKGLQHWCRECFADYFRRRGEKHIRQVRAATVKRVAATRERMAAYLAEHPCCNCHRRVTGARRRLAREAGTTVSGGPP